MENTSIRLKRLMSERNLKQVDILNLVKPICKKYSTRLGKNDLSQYISGKVSPGQWKLLILSEALNVTEGWLMGLDVPKNRNTDYNETDNIMVFGYTLFKLLEHSSISEEELASKLDININVIKNAIQGTELPNNSDINKLTKFFNIKNVNDLFDNTEYNRLVEIENTRGKDEIDILYSKYKDILTDEDKEYMKFIIEKRKREIDKQLGEDK